MRKSKFTKKGSRAANKKLKFEEIDERSWTLQSSVTVVDGESAHNLTESSLGEFIRFGVEGSGEMVKGDVREGTSQPKSFVFPTDNMDGTKAARAIYPIYYNF
jgi:hypothetical protein